MVTLLTQKMEALAFQKAVQEDAPFVKRDFVSQSLTTAQVELNFYVFEFVPDKCEDRRGEDFCLNQVEQRANSSNPTDNCYEGKSYWAKTMRLVCSKTCGVALCYN